MAENGLDGEIKKVRTFKSELLEAKKAYENLVLTKAPTEDIAAAAQKLAEVKDAADDAAGSVGALTSAGKFQAVTKSITAVAGGFTAVQGAIGLVSNDSKALTATFAKVQSAMALTQGLTALEDVGDSFKNLKTVAVDSFKSLGSISSKVLMTLKANLVKTGIGIIVLAVGALIANFETLGKTVDKFIPGFSKFAETIMKGVTAITDFLGLTDSLAASDKKATEARDKNVKSIENQIKVAKAEGKQKKVLALEEQEILMKLAQARQDYQTAVRNEDAKALKEAGQRIIDLKNELKVKGIEQQKFADEEKKKSDEAGKKVSDAAEERRKKELEKEKAFQEKKRDLVRSNALAGLTDEQEIAKKKQDFAYQDRLREIKNLEISEKKKAELRELALTENENALAKIKKDFADKQKVEDEKKAQDTKKFLADTEKEKLDLQQEELTKQRDELLKGLEETNPKRKEIEEAYQAQRAALTKQYDDKIVEDQLKTETEAVDKRLAVQKAAITKGLYEGTMSVKEARQKEREIEEQALNDRLAAARKAGKGIEEAEAALYQYKSDKREEDKQANIDAVNAGLDLAASAAQAGQDLSDAFFAGKLANVEKGSAEETAILEKQFETNKKIQIAQTLISGANGLVNLLGAKSVIPEPGASIQRGINIALLIATTAASIAKISAAKFEAPKSAGSKFAEGGLLSGPSHDRGGIRNYFGEMEGGEFIVNKQSSAAFLPLLERINELGNSNSAMANQAAPGPTQQPIIKTYVVASDVSSQQEADKRIADLAAL
jgi:hypothetical protein